MLQKKGYSKTPFRSVKWSNLASNIARMISTEDQGEEYENRVDMTHNVLCVVADHLWDQYAKDRNITTYQAIKEEAIALHKHMEKESLLFILLTQGAKQAMYPDFPRGRGLGLRKKTEGSSQVQTSKTEL